MHPRCKYVHNIPGQIDLDKGALLNEICVRASRIFTVSNEGEFGKLDVGSITDGAEGIDEGDVCEKRVEER